MNRKGRKVAAEIRKENKNSADLRVPSASSAVKILPKV
jgi:hypothetical protein